MGSRLCNSVGCDHAEVRVLRLDLVQQIKKLERLDLQYTLDGSILDIAWFRVMYEASEKQGHWHAHANPEIHYTYDGEKTVYFEDKEVCVPAEHAILIGPGLRHSLAKDNGQPKIRFVLSFDIVSAKDHAEMQLVEKILLSPGRAIFPMNDRMNHLLMICLEEAIERRLGFLSQLKSHILSFLIYLARMIASEESINYTIPIRQNIEDHRAENIIAYINREIINKVRVRDVAQHVNLSEKQVQRIISSRYGITVNQMIMDIKLKKAKELMKSPQMTLEQISSTLGFANEQYFSRFFKKLEGMPPNRYRKSMLP